MPSGSVRRVSRQDIQLVQNLIERCLQLYMNQKEVVDTLLDQAKIEPDFTSLVWQKLEEENQEFFKAYYLRLMVKHQIMEFNRLLDQQVRLMHQIHPQSGVSSIPATNGNHIPTLHQTSPCFAPERVGPTMKPETIHPSCLPNAYTNGRSSMHSGMHNVIDLSPHAGRIDAPQNMLSTQNSHMGLMQGMNGGGMVKPEVGMVKPEIGGPIKSEVGYSNSSPYMFGVDSNVLGRPNIGDHASVAPFSSIDPNPQALSEAILDSDTSSFGFLGQIPRNFSLSDLTADFSQSSDILESYSRSPFLAPDGDFLDSRDRGEPQGDNRRLDTISEGLSYEDFGSE